MVDRIITDVQPDKVLLFNGRANDARPEWEISQLHNIPFVSCESICVFHHKYLKDILWEYSSQHYFKYRDDL